MIHARRNVTVLMPVFNAAVHLREAIDSVLAQTYRDFELLMINDGSTDASVEIIKGYNDPRIRLLHNETNQGLVKTLNRGMDLAAGSYIARMDADDICAPERLTKQVDFLEKHSEIEILGGAIHFFGGIRQPYTHVFPESHDDIRAALLFYCPLAHPAVMFRRTLVERKLVQYSDRFRHAEDYHLWSQLLLRARAANLPHTVLNYRLHSQQVSSGQTGKQYEASLRVRKLMLEQAGVKWTEAEIDLHESVILERYLEGGMCLEKMGSWFARLEEANHQTKFLDSSALHRLLVAKSAEVAQRAGITYWSRVVTPPLKRYLLEGGYRPKVLEIGYRRTKRWARRLVRG